MSTADLLDRLEHLDNGERLIVIERATRLIREDLSAAAPRPSLDVRLRAAALQAKDAYEPGGELTEWTCLDGEDFLDDTTPG